jgi:hypothetical protein
MNFLKDMAEHPIVQGISIAGIITGFALDSMDKSEYFSWAAIIITMVLIYVAYEVYSKRKMYQTEVLPIPIAVNIDSSETSTYVLKNLFDELEKNTKLKNLKTNLKRYRNIVDDDLSFTYNGDLYDKKRILSFMQIIKYQIRKIKENTPNKVEFHLAYYKRPAHGIFLGYVFSDEDLVLYQNDPDEDQFNKVAEMKNRNYKKEVRRYQKFNINYLKEDAASDQLLIGIKASSHKINFNAPSLINYKNVIYLEAKHDGTIKPDEDWVQYGREIFTLLNEKQTQYKSITIAHNMPETIGVMLGMAVGNYWSLIITQYDIDTGDYLEVMNTNEIKCYF